MTRKKALIICEILKDNYDANCALLYTTDFELLFATRLSAQCTDERVNIVTRDMFAKFKTLEDYANADIIDIEDSIKTCGLYHVKARDIKACAALLIENFNSKVPSTMDELLSLPGIGRKTANLILGDIYGQPAIVADTHCMRLAGRLGFTDGTRDPLKVEIALKKIIPKNMQSDFCHRLVFHGRSICTARKAHCEICPLASVCKSFVN